MLKLKHLFISGGSQAFSTENLTELSFFHQQEAKFNDSADRLQSPNSIFGEDKSTEFNKVLNWGQRVGKFILLVFEVLHTFH